MPDLIRKLLTGLSANTLMQGVLRKNVALSQYLMGIGSGSETYCSGEQAILDELCSRLVDKQAPACVFDTGANTGQFALVILRGLQKVGQEVLVHSFEPARGTFEALSANLSEYEKSVVLNNFGLGNTSGVFELHYDKAGSGLASLTKRRMTHFKMDFNLSENVQIETLDNYCAAKNIQHIDLLKLDVEGHELDVLRGGSRMFAENRVGMVSLEFGGCNIDTRTFFQDFWYFFQENGMGRIYRITPSGFLVPIREYSESQEQFRTTNFVVMRSTDNQRR